MNNSNNLDRVFFGTASIGSKSNYFQSIKILEKVYSLGIKNFDSGPLYGACQSHQIINDFSKEKNDIKVTSKFLSKMHNPYREICKLVLIGCGLNAYKNYWYTNQIYKKATKRKLTSEDIEDFISYQKNLYPNINFVEWFLHSPTKIMLNNFLKISSKKRYGFSTELINFKKVKEASFIQTDAFSIFKANLNKLKAKKILVNRIHTFAFSQKRTTLATYKDLLELDPRINIIIGTRNVQIIKNIVKSIS